LGLVRVVVAKLKTQIKQDHDEDDAFSRFARYGSAI